MNQEEFVAAMQELLKTEIDAVLEAVASNDSRKVEATFNKLIEQVRGDSNATE